MDAPYAPKALGYLFAKAVASGVADLKDLEAHVKDVEEVFSRRDYGEAVFKYLQVQDPFMCTVLALLSLQDFLS